MKKGDKCSQETIEKMRNAKKGKNHPMYNKSQSKESNKKRSKTLKGRVPWNIGLTKETSSILKKISTKAIGHISLRKNLSNIEEYGEYRAKKIRIQNAKKHKGTYKKRFGKKKANDIIKRRSETIKQKHKIKNNIKNFILWINKDEIEAKKKIHRKENAKKNSERKIEYYKTHNAWNYNLTKETDSRVMKSAKGVLNAKKRGCYNIKPNKPETIIINLLKENNLPYKYVGDYKFWIEHKNPDFINTNGQKKLIEHNGIYWHGVSTGKNTKQQEEARMNKIYSKYGFKCLHIWEDEMKDLEKVKNKLIEF